MSVCVYVFVDLSGAGRQGHSSLALSCKPHASVGKVWALGFRVYGACLHCGLLLAGVTSVHIVTEAAPVSYLSRWFLWETRKLSLMALWRYLFLNTFGCPTLQPSNVRPKDGGVTRDVLFTDVVNPLASTATLNRRPPSERV